MIDPQGANERARDKGDIALNCLQDFDQWKDRIEPDGVVAAMNDYLTKNKTPHHCHRLILPGISHRRLCVLNVAVKWINTSCTIFMENFDNS
ncbi:hypothetical protein RJT34_30285 [Clitoria ternatea]|uniref:Sieve element occlusion C-terminal domain-containing protein n=1 Tax=Clitoria ternatea TaxID=43366 RepID=A0AAN9ET07_CLITE